MKPRRLLVVLALVVIAAACASNLPNEAASEPIPESTAETTTTIPGEPTTTTSTTTTEPLPETACSTDRYEVQLPEGWSHQDCGLLTSADGSLEITLEMTIGESYRDAIRGFASANIVDASLATAGAADAVRLEIDLAPPVADDASSTTFVVDTGDGNFVASGPEPFIDEVMSGATINSVAPPPVICSAEPGVSTADIVLKVGEVDIDGDGDLELFALFSDDDVTFVEIDGLAAVEGVVSAPVQFGRTDPQAVLGWADWDGDGLPEIITREPAGPAFGDVHHVHSIDGCDIERVATLVNDARAGSTDLFVCDRDDDGVLNTLTTMLIRQTPDVSPAEITNRSITSIFTAGVLISLETQVAVTTDAADLTPTIDGPINLEGCGSFFG